jgi:hypothetical protein
VAQFQIAKLRASIAVTSIGCDAEATNVRACCEAMVRRAHSAQSGPAREALGRPVVTPDLTLEAS